MTQYSYPFDASVVTEIDWARMAQYMGGLEGVYGSVGGTSLAPTAPGGGMTVAVAAGEAVVGGHFYWQDASTNLTIGANASGSPRIDLIVLRRDVTANSVVLAVKAGTPAASPTAPALTRTFATEWEFPIASVRVNNGVGTIGSGDVTDLRVFTSARPVRQAATAAARTAILSAQPGDLVFQNDEKRHYLYTGTLWVAQPAVAPRAMAAGTANVRWTSSTTVRADPTSVAFPAGRFSAAPVVVCSINSSLTSTRLMTAHPVSVTASGFAIQAFNNDSPGAYLDTDVAVMWHAVQM